MELIPLTPGLGYLMPAGIRKPTRNDGYNRCKSASEHGDCPLLIAPG